MNINEKIDKFLSRKVINEQYESDLASDILNLLNSLDDEFLDDDQVALKDRILSSNFTVNDEGYTEDFDTAYPEEDDTQEVDIPEDLGDADLYGYDETDFTTEDKKKVRIRSSLLGEGKKKKTKKANKKTK